MDDEVLRQARSFGGVADAYERGRPGFPTEAARWLVGRDAATVLELGAGTGKLTEQLVALGHDVHATDPDAEMLAILKKKLPDIPASEAAAEEIPLADHSVDVVVAAQCLHWFDLDRALPEIARVLKPGGYLAVTWNVRDERIPWVRRLGNLIGTQEQLREPEAPLVHSGLFGFVEDETFHFWQDVNRESIIDLVASRSNIATLPDEERADRLRQVLAFYDDYGRGMDGMQLPYHCSCFRAQVITQPERATASAQPDDGSVTDTGTIDPPRDDDGGDDMLLIDFR
jgi:SAM-dependent methyltransferase